jgi:hypothetical protein
VPPIGERGKRHGIVMNKPPVKDARKLSELLRKTLGDAFAKQGFASIELVTRWRDIVGPEIAEQTQPEKIQWSRAPQTASAPEPGTLVLRVEGPTALEIQHLSGVILQRVNRFFGWQAVAALKLRQAPLARGARREVPVPLDPAIAARLAAQLPEIKDENLRAALARLGAAIARG